MRVCAKKSWTRVFNSKMSTEKKTIKTVEIFAGSGKWDGDFNGQRRREIVQYGYMYFSFIF